MKASMFIMAALLVSGTAFADAECTTEPKTKWLDKTAFQKSLTDKGYKIKVFKETKKGNCYEIYGWDKAGKKVEIYFNPVTGAVVKEEIEK